MIGESVGNFRILRLLGRGGMGEVWLAEHHTIRTRVAIKLLLPHVSANRQHVQRFFNEAIAVSKIKHSGIAKIFDVGFLPRGDAYLVMEFLEGESLAGRIQRSGRLPLGQLADIGEQIAGVLDATHVEGITHRDLKPDNVYLVRDAELESGERVKILDFGIAKLGGSTMKLTEGAVSMGTPAYMSPEQWKSSADVDGRADAYSLGCLVFEMASGRPPFVAESMAEACNQHLNVPAPSLADSVHGVPPKLDELIARLLAKDPARRPGMREIKATFAALGEGQPGALATTFVDRVPTPSMPKPASTPAPVPPNTTLGSGAGAIEQAAARPAKHRRTLWLALAATGCAAGGLTVYLATRSGPTKPAAALHASDAAMAAANSFVHVEPPRYAARVLGVSATDTGKGFRPSRHVVTPDAPYGLQAHEVTWGELESWLTAHPDPLLEIPPWATDLESRARLPVSGMSWAGALAYCQSLRASLPTEAQWEYAARGPALRSHPWGETPVLIEKVHAFAGTDGIPVTVGSSELDRTPEPAIFDLAGNVQEWTLDLWREDEPGQDESWVEDPATHTTFRAVRGLPLAIELPTRLPAVSVAHREPLCATGPCVDKSRKALRYVGFRCARPEPSR